MIKSIDDLRRYLAEDLSRFGKKPGLKDWILKNEVWYVWHYIVVLRHVEYHLNTGHKLRYFWYFFWYKQMCFRHKVYIFPNNVGPGFRLMHLGALVHLKPDCKIGKNCTILPGVVIGNKYLKGTKDPVYIGDNCYFGLGAKVFGSVRIGNNVTVGANSVVTKDIPDNAIVAGVPAKVIRFVGE